jgi:hypothetical protein
MPLVSSYNPEDAMIHYTCDRCHREINPDVEVRYAVELQVRPIFDEQRESSLDPDADHLSELHELLERLDESEEEAGGCCDGDACAPQQFDLCSDCYKVYARNPLAREFHVGIGFSEN